MTPKEAVIAGIVGQRGQRREICRHSEVPFAFRQASVGGEIRNRSRCWVFLSDIFAFGPFGWLIPESMPLYLYHHDAM